jgi:hypothetical protein
MIKRGPRAYFYVFIISLLLLYSCASTAEKSQTSALERIESILIINDTGEDVRIVYSNITIASKEDVVVKPGEKASISLKGVWSAKAVAGIAKNLREYVVLRLLEKSAADPKHIISYKEDEAIKRIAENLSREDHEWIIRMSRIFE